MGGINIVQSPISTERVVAFTTLRLGGVSQAPFNSLNLAGHVGDNPDHVAENRARIADYLPGCSPPVWLEQVHGVQVVAAHDVAAGEMPVADASWTSRPGLPLVILTADCLPIVLVNRAETKVAIAHAGWRGLAAGIVPELMRHLGNPQDLRAWIGPGILQPAFEVGSDVVRAFVGSLGKQVLSCFQQGVESEKFYADLPALAKIDLQRAGVLNISGGTWCTATDSKKFFSHRRDGLTGRMATIVALLP